MTTTVTLGELTPQERQARACDLYRRSLAEGAPLSGRALGARFGMSERWGRKVIASVRSSQDGNGGGADQSNGTVTDRPAQRNGTRDVPPGDHVAADCDRPGALPIAERAPTGTTAAASADGTRRETTGELPGWIDPVTRLSVALVALAAGLWSVDHLAEVSRLAGTVGWKVWLLPVAVDGLASTASLVLYRAHRLHQPAGPLAWTALVVSLAASVAGNIVATYPELVAVGPLKVAVGATPPVSLALALHLLLHQSHLRQQPST